MFKSAEEALSVLKSNDKVFIHTAIAAPQLLINALAERGKTLQNIQVYQLHTEGDAPYAAPEMHGHFHINAFFVGKNTRNAVREGRGSYVPIFLSEIPKLFRRKIIKLDIALIQVSPPDKHGFCSLGVSVDVARAAEENAAYVIAQVNEHMPRTHGDGLIHVSHIDAMVEGHLPLPEIQRPTITDVERQIGRNVASLIEDRATLQMGIGAIPDATLSFLGNHKDLGVHTEMFSDGVLELVKKGIITGEYKVKHPRKIVSSFAMGSRELYDFMDDNPAVVMLESDYVNNTEVIRKNPNVTAINSAIEIDLTGQVCADSIGNTIYSGVGGQMDFIRGASVSENGKPIIALPSTTRKGISRIVPYLKEGAGVVTTRAHVHYVVTEYGIAYLHGKSIEERAKALIEIAHPDHRDALEAQHIHILA